MSDVTEQSAKTAMFNSYLNMATEYWNQGAVAGLQSTFDALAAIRKNPMLWSAFWMEFDSNRAGIEQKLITELMLVSTKQMEAAKR
jgi:hypothetical protein